MKWPKDTQADLEAFYGKHEIGDDGNPTERWENSALTRLDFPYPMRLSWKPDETVRRTRVHRAVASSLGTALEKLLAKFGREELTRLGLDLYGGCYCFRRARGLGRLSVHAWGAAVDLDPDRNALGTKGQMSPDAVKIFEAEGWTWGGRWPKRPDAMHFQAAG